MNFGEDNFELLLSKHLTSDQKTRLKDSLSQFSMDRFDGGTRGDIDYTNFVIRELCDYFKQADILLQIRYPYLNDSTYEFEKYYTTAIILSNTCDISPDNTHNLNKKQCVFAPVIELSEYIQALIEIKKDEKFTEEKLTSFINEIKSQRITNLFYITDNSTEYIALFDKVFWFPTDELNTLLEDISGNKLFSLTLFGYYLFLLKLTFHFSRFPETPDRSII